MGVVLNLKAVCQFKKDFKKYHHKKPVLEEFKEVIKMFRNGNKFPEKVLLFYSISEESQTLYLERIGSHSELF